MGDGGVACVPLQPIMDKFPASETSSSNGKLETKPAKRTATKRMKLKRDAFFKDEQQQLKEDLGTEKVNNSGKEVENVSDQNLQQKEEVEEGELGTLKSPRREVENGELTPENGEIFSSNKLRNDEVDNDHVSWRKSAQPERLGFNSGRLLHRGQTPEKYKKGEEYDNAEFSSWRGSNKDEAERGEFFPDRWHKGEEVVKSEYGYSKGYKPDSNRERERRYERDWTPPSGKYPGEDVSPGRDFNRRGNRQHSKKVARWGVNNQEKSYQKLSSKVDDIVPSYKNEQKHGRSQGREQHSSNTLLKRHGTHTEDSIDRKDYDVHGSSKSRKLSGCNYRGAGYSDHYSRQGNDKLFRKPNSTRSFPDRHSLRQYDSSSSREAYDRHRRSPSYPERSPRERERGRYNEHRDWTPSRSERSPCYRGNRRDDKNQSPSYAERSPQDRPRQHDRRERSPSYLERSPHERGRLSCHRKTARRNEDSSDNKQSDRLAEEKPAQRNTGSKDSEVLLKDPSSRNNIQNGSIEKSISHEIHPEDQVRTPSGDGKERPLVVNGVNEELLSMEEDMDICDTPPHVPSVLNVNPGKWYYLDHLGDEHGPSRLCELKVLVDEGKMMSDHLVKHSDSDRWVSVENAASPLARTNFTPVFSDSVTQLASPPEAPGNVLVEVGDAEQSGNQIVVESPNAFAQAVIRVDDSLSLKDFSIDLRVGALLDGFTVIPGKELEIVGEALQMSFDQSEWERFGSVEGITQDHPSCEELSEQNQEVDILRHPDTASKDSAESASSGSFDKECGYLFSDFTEWFSGRWSCKGGDWQRNDEVVQEKSFRKKLVLNEGYPICQMSKSGYEDPRWQRKEDLYFPCQGRKLDIPSWALSWSDEKIDCNVNKSAQSKPGVVRGVKGTVMPVVRINACVVKDSGPFASESRSKHRENDKYSSRGSKHHSSSSDTKRLAGEDTFHPKSFNELCPMESWKPTSVFNKPKDRLCTVGDLQLHLGDWYYLDGTGHEHGPYSCRVLRALVQEGSLKKESSVFRKIDEVWVPVTSVIKASKDDAKLSEESTAPSGGTSEAYVAVSVGNSLISSLFHSLHPQFIGYTHGKLHELVMKSYKSREFAAAINEVLDPWINSRQPKKEIEKHLFNKTTSRSYLSLQKSSLENRVSSLYEDDTYSRKKRRTTIDGVEEEYEIGEDLPLLCYNEPSFDDLCGDSAFCKEKDECYENEVGSWGLLDGHVLARIFHFLRTDVKSLVFSALTCKHWKAAVGFYKNLSIRVDLSTLGSNCTDSAIGSFLNGYDKQMVKALVLDGCTNISSAVLLEILQSFPRISCVDIRGCNQFEDLVLKFPHVNWVMGHDPQDMRIVDDSNSKIRSSKHMAEQTSSVSKLGHARYMDESSGLKDYFDMVDRRGAENQAFRQSLYKRTKVVDARRSASALARDARMRHWAIKEAGSGYRKMEEFLVISLKDIMKGKTSDYFSPKVAEIESRIKSGYYARHGLNSAKQDIIKMCREAVKTKNRGGGGDMENMIPLFIKLGTSLDGKAAVDRDEIMKKLRDEASGSYGYKKYNRSVMERKYTARAGSSFPNGVSDYMEYSSDRELRRNLSKVSKKLSSESGSSDEFELSSEDDESDTESVSDTQSDSDMRSEGSALESKDGCVAVDETFDMIPDDREWGARMTKASLVPPVTRKYEVIDHYVIVADEVEVLHKMRVSLPDDYEDKMKAQKNGSEEIDMEIPEVKEYKPRKQVGEEVIEQEVYGIDPYTYNLLLDSMPEDLDWSPTEKHIFVEDVLLRVLNKQVRQYTGSRSTPMIYPLKPVVEELLATSKESHDTRTAKMCEALLNAINTRREDNYVAYRKGLGVVCNKQDGFVVDDFVVEFLGEVYPAWKWFEKQDGIRSLQKNSKEPAPEFYNIYLERPKGDADGYDLVVVDAMHKANYASRICHSCKPNCEAKVTAVGGQYQIGIYSTRPIGFGEEVTFDYNSVTESKEEYEASVCLCGSTVCRGSYLNLTGQGAFQKVLKECHGLLDKHRLLLEACQLNWVSEEDYIELGRAGLGNCLLGGLPDWLVAYSAKLVRFINFERTKLPEEILKHNLDEKRKYYTEISIEVEKSDAEIQAEGVYNQRLQNLALTLNKVRYVLRCVFGDPKKAPPPLQKLTSEEMVSVVWNGDGSLVSDLLECIAPHIDDRMLQDLKSKIRAHDPSTSSNMEKELRKSLLWLRDEVRGLPCTYKSRHDAAADIIHLYAYTRNLFKIREYKTVTSPPVYISPLDLGPKCADKLSGVTEYCKIYGENYCLGQLIYWHNQANADPDRVLARASRGCLSLPDICSFYAKAQTPSRQRVYGPRTVRFMLARMEKQRQRLWPKDRIWCFKSSPKVFGSPMLDSVLRNCALEREMVVWLKNRPAIFQAMWDR